MSDEGLKPRLVEKIFKRTWEERQGSRVNMEDEHVDSRFQDTQDVTKIQSDALVLSSELLRLFLLEALYRAQEEAMIDDSPDVQPHHIEQILVQLMLDF